MSDHLEQKSTELSTTNPIMIGGLVLLSIPFIPILAVVGVFQALDTITESLNNKRLTEPTGKEDKNGQMD